MVNKYLVKIAEKSKEQPGPFSTAVQQGIAGIIPDIVGGAAGAKVGSRFGVKGTAIGTMAGAGLGGLTASYAVLKRQQIQRDRQMSKEAELMRSLMNVQRRGMQLTQGIARRNLTIPNPAERNTKNAIQKSKELFHREIALTKGQA